MVLDLAVITITWLSLSLLNWRSWSAHCTFRLALESVSVVLFSYTPHFSLLAPFFTPSHQWSRQFLSNNVVIMSNVQGLEAFHLSIPSSVWFIFEEHYKISIRYACFESRRCVFSGCRTRRKVVVKNSWSCASYLPLHVVRDAMGMRNWSIRWTNDRWRE